jgi:pimeloyl-ACP methyl ester carboxylesterase
VSRPSADSARPGAGPGTDLAAHRFASFDGAELAWHETGAGRPLVLLHGLFGSGAQLAESGLAQTLAGQGYRVILPDLRGHGDSAGPHDPARYPPDVLAADGLALIGHLGLDDYDLGGYSLGGRLVLRLLARGARPGRAFVGGQGLDATDAGTSRTGGHRRLLTALVNGETFAAGSPDAQLAAGLAANGVDPQAVRYVLDTFVATSPGELRQVPAPVLIVVGDGDSRGATAGDLAALLPDTRLVRVAGDHYTALGAPEFTDAVLAFLRGR